MPWRVNANGVTPPGGNGSNAALDSIYDSYELKAIKSDLPELSWTSKIPAGLMTETKVDFSKENVEYPIPEIWDNQPDTTAVLKASQTGRFKIAPYLLGHSIPDNPEDFGKYDNYYQRFDRQKYKAFFDDRDLVPKKIVEYMIKDSIADKITIGHANEADTLQPLNDIKETYGAMVNTSPDPIALKSYVDTITTDKLVDGFVTTVKIALGTITLNELTQNTINSHMYIPDGSITADKLASNSVNAIKIVDGQVLTAKIADSAITALKLAMDAVETAKIKDRAITAAKIAPGTITLNELAQSVIDVFTNTGIPDDSITVEKLAASAVETVKIKDSNVTTRKIAGSAITSAKPAASALTADHFPSTLNLGTKILQVPTPSLPS